MLWSIKVLSFYLDYIFNLRYTKNIKVFTKAMKKMKIKSIKINYYKSIGNENNRLDIDPAVTVIIGKNESGKSNVLTAVKNLRLNGNKLPNTDRNRLYREMPTSVSVVAVFLLSESNITTETTFVFTEQDIKYSGGITEYFNNNVEINDFINYIEQLPCLQNQGQLNTYINNLKNFGETSLYNIIDIVKAIKQFLKIVPTTNEVYDKKQNLAIIELEKIIGLLPRFYLHDGRLLNNLYQASEIDTEQKYRNANNIKLAKLIDFLKFKRDDLIFAMGSTVNNPNVEKMRDDISQAFQTKVAKPFLDFYKQEQVGFYIAFDQSSLRFGAKSNNTPYMLSERSNGLQWYFNLYVSLITEEIADKNIVLLIDEPGISLHITAQSELLKLFDDLCEKNKQIIYTTHSPFMLDTDKLGRIRPIEKDENGITRINNKHYAELEGLSTIETLSPLIHAMGATFSKLSPELNNLYVITEGIIDSLYIKAMLDFLEVSENNKPFIIPCVGVGHEHDIASILIGWGCDFKCLIDYDKAGYDESKVLNKLDLLYSGKVITVNTKYINKADMEKNSETIESLLSSEDRDKLMEQTSVLARVLTGKKILQEEKEQLYNDKITVAMKFGELVASGKLQPTEATTQNYKRLFQAFGINLT